jgi:hypothetical protein
MTRLENLPPGAQGGGVLHDAAAQVVQVDWHGSSALTLTQTAALLRRGCGFAWLTARTTGPPARQAMG